VLFPSSVAGGFDVHSLTRTGYFREEEGGAAFYRCPEALAKEEIGSS